MEIEIQLYKESILTQRPQSLMPWPNYHLPFWLLPLSSTPANITSSVFLVLRSTMSPTRKESSPLDQTITPPVYMRGSYCLADLLSPGDGGKPAKIRQAADNHMIFCQPFQKIKRKNRRGTKKSKWKREKWLPQQLIFLDDGSVLKQWVPSTSLN